jgi:hypothetical protein
VADYLADRIRNERDCKLSGLSQCADDVLHGVTCVWRIQKGGDRHSLNSRDIGRGLFSNLDLNGADCSASFAKNDTWLGAEEFVRRPLRWRRAKPRAQCAWRC